MRAVQVLLYDPRWPARFATTAAELRAALGPAAVAVHHVGSTAVPGLAAKPVVDVLAVADDLGAVDGAEPSLVGLGYEPRGEYGLPGRRYFVRGADGRRTDHVHVYGEGDPAVARHLAVRDYLRAHPEEAAGYGALKAAVAGRYPDDNRRYAEAKGPFVAALERRALAWAARAGAAGAETDGTGGRRQ